MKAQWCCKVWPAAHWLLGSRVMCRGPAVARLATLMTWPLLAGTTMLHSSKHRGSQPLHTEDVNSVVIGGCGKRYEQQPGLWVRKQAPSRLKKFLLCLFDSAELRQALKSTWDTSSHT